MSLVEVIRTLVWAASCNIVITDFSLKASHARARAVVQTHTVERTVVFAKLLFTTLARKAFFTSASAIVACTTVVAILGVLTRKQVASWAGKSIRTLARPVITYAVVATRLGARLAGAVGTASVSIAFANAIVARALARAVLGATSFGAIL